MAACVSPCITKASYMVDPASEWPCLDVGACCLQLERGCSDGGGNQESSGFKTGPAGV